MADIDFLNEVCRQLFEATEPVLRRRAEEVFNELLESPECLNKCFMIFEQGIVPYGPMTACKLLERLVSRKVGLTNEKRTQLLQYILKYSMDRVGTLPNFVENALCLLYGRLTKLSWSDEVTDSPFQEVVTQLMEVIKEENERSILAMRLLTSLIDDMSNLTGFEKLGNHIKVSRNFRDRHLCDIYMLTIDQFKLVTSKDLNGLRLVYIEYLFVLASASLSFHFEGQPHMDESCKVPASWKSPLIDRNPVKFFFELYFKLPVKLVTTLFQHLVLLAAIRRAIFDSTDRQKFLSELLNGIRSVLLNPAKLEQSDNFNEFCQLISRVMSNFQLLELMNDPDFPEVLSMVTEFTFKSFQVAEAFGQNGVYHLMISWQILASAVRTSSTSKPETITSCFPKITIAFILSRMSLAKSVVREGIDDPLDESHEMLKQIMECFSLICRIQYAENVEQISNEFDANTQIIATPGVGSNEVRISQKRLVWLVYMIGAAIEGKTLSLQSSKHELFDGELAARVLKLMEVNDAQLTPGINDPDRVHLEMAFIYFLENLRKMYLTEILEGKIFDKLKDLINISESRHLVEVFARKIITNLKFWYENEEICHGSLKLLNELTTGLIPSRRLLAIEDIQLLLRNHASQHFAFLAPTPNLKLMKARTVFYEALMRLMSIELEDDLSKFQEFLQPLTTRFNEISDAFESLDVNANQLKLAVIGLSRDVRGLAMSCTNNAIFALLLNWLIPEVSSLLIRSIELWYENVEVTTPILRLLAELAHNRQPRMAFEMKSCTSVVLFREISKILCFYGDRFLSIPSLSESVDVYKRRLKNYGICFEVLRNVLSGNYLPFGIFWLYGDLCLKNALDVIFRMFMALKNDHPEFMQYPKIGQNILYLLEAVMKDNTSYVTKIDPNVLRAVLHTCHNGIAMNLVSNNHSVVTTSCSIIESLLDYLYRRISRPQNEPPPPFHEPEGDVVYNLMYAQQPDLMYPFLDTIMNMVVFELLDGMTNHSIGRVLMGLLLVYYKSFEQWKQQFMVRQPTEMQQALEEAFGSLTTGIKYSISSRNKDDFTKNMTNFKIAVAQILRGNKLVEESEQVNDGMASYRPGGDIFAYSYIGS